MSSVHLHTSHEKLMKCDQYVSIFERDFFPVTIFPAMIDGDFRPFVAWIDVGLTSGSPQEMGLSRGIGRCQPRLAQYLVWPVAPELILQSGQTQSIPTLIE